MSDLQDDRVEEHDDTQEELDPQQLREQLEQKERDIQFLKGKWGEEKAELQRELQTRLAEFDGRISEQREMMGRKNEPTPDPWALDEDTARDIADDPTKIVPLMKSRIEKALDEKIGMIVDVLRERDGAYKGEFESIKGLASSLKKELDPNIRAWKSEIDELRKNEKLAGLDEETLIEIAKAKGAKPNMEYRGEAGGQRYRQSQEKARTFEAAGDSEKSLLLKLANGNVEEAKKMFVRYEARRIGQ